jgi:hypothetical protein
MDERTRLKLEIAARFNAAMVSRWDPRYADHKDEFSKCAWDNAKEIIALAERECTAATAECAPTAPVADMVATAKLQEEVKDLRERLEICKVGRNEWKSTAERNAEECSKYVEESARLRRAVDQLEAEMNPLRAAANEMSEILGLGDVPPSELVECVRLLCDENESLTEKNERQPNLLPVESHGSLFSVRSANANYAAFPVLTSSEVAAHEMAEALKVPVYRVRLEEIPDG